MISRRSFLRILGIGLVAGPTLVRAALKPDTLVASGGMTLEKLKQAADLMNAAEVPAAERMLIISPYYATQFDENWREIMSQRTYPLAEGEIDNFVGFTFIRTPLVEPPITAADVRKCRELGMSLDDRINNRYRPATLFRWVRDVRVESYVDQGFLDDLKNAGSDFGDLLHDVPPVSGQMFADVSAMLRRSWARVWS